MTSIILEYKIVNNCLLITDNLNSVRCRRKDITDIFLGTGLGPRSYAAKALECIVILRRFWNACYFAKFWNACYFAKVLECIVILRSFGVHCYFAKVLECKIYFAFGTIDNDFFF